MTRNESPCVWVMRVVVLAGLISAAVAGFPRRGFAQTPTSSTDPFQQLTERVEALEREYDRLESLIREQTADHAAAQLVPPAPSTARGVAPYAPPSYRSSFIERIDEGLGTRYDNGFVLVETPDSQRVPFRLQFNLFNQFRYLNQELDSSSFTDHLGVVRPVERAHHAVE